MAKQHIDPSEANDHPDEPTKLPSANELMRKLAIVEAAKASEAMRKEAEEAAEKTELIERLAKPSGLTDEEVMRRTLAIIERAVAAGRTSVQVYRFPNELCTDRARAINQGEPGWPETLTGVPKEIFAFWQKHLRPLGYKIRCEIVDFPGGMPGDVSLTLRWG